MKLRIGSRFTWRAGSLALTLAAALVVAACGDDDGSTESMATPPSEAPMATEAAPAPTAGAYVDGAEHRLAAEAAAVTAVCDSIRDIDGSFIHEDFEGVIAAVTTLAENAPPDLREDIEPFMELFGQDPEAAFEDQAALRAAETATDQFALARCDATILEVAAADYSYEGLPDRLEAGRYVIDLENVSEAGEEHEAIIVRKNDGVTLSAAELFELDEEEAQQLVTPIGAAYTAGDDVEDVTVVDLEPGEYFFVCLLPIGGDDGGAPHYTAGMVHEITVS